MVNITPYHPPALFTLSCAKVGDRLEHGFDPNPPLRRSLEGIVSTRIRLFADIYLGGPAVEALLVDLALPFPKSREGRMLKAFAQGNTDDYRKVHQHLTELLHRYKHYTDALNGKFELPG